MLPEIRSPIAAWLWSPALEAHSGPLRVGVKVLRYTYALLREVFAGDLTLRAMSLVYTTLLSIVPLLALSLSVLKGFGIHREFQPMLTGLLEPLGPENAERIAARLVGLVDNVQGLPLVGFGLLFVFYTAVSMLQKIESSFNYVWLVAKPRSFARRFSEYISVLVIGPALMVIATGLIASASSNRLVQWFAGIEPFGQLLVFAGKLVPYVVVIFVFTFLYVLFPNTRVRFRPALAGGIAGGVLWAATSAFFASFVANSSNRTAIYNTFAIGIVALLWLYLNWLILLVGAQLSFYVQHPEYLLTGREDVRIPNRTRELLALAVMRHVGNEFLAGRKGPKVNELAPDLGVPATMLTFVMDRLERSDLIILTENERLIPGRSPESMSLEEIVDAVRRSGASAHTHNPTIAAVAPIADEIENAIGRTLEGHTLRELLDDPAPADAPAPVAKAPGTGPSPR